MRLSHTFVFNVTSYEWDEGFKGELGGFAADGGDAGDGHAQSQGDQGDQVQRGWDVQEEEAQHVHYPT